jgi:ABC-type Fe3+-hydroxamate transport system substrate-binding protein
LRAAAACAALLVCAFAAAAFGGCGLRPETPETGARTVVLDDVSLEILDRLGLEVVGVPSTGWERVGAKYGDRERYGDAGLAMQPNYAEIALLNPSEVVMSDATEKAFGNIKSSFGALGIPVKFYSYNSIPDLKNSVLQIGGYFGKAEEAAAVVAELDAGEADALGKIAALPAKPRVMVLFGAPIGTAAQSISIATGGLYAGGIAAYAGAVNVADELYGDSFGMIKPDNWPPVLALEPDYIFCAAHGDPARVWAMYDACWDTSPWNMFEAARNGRVFYLPADTVGIIASFGYAGALRYIADIFEGKVNPYGGGYKAA